MKSYSIPFLLTAFIILCSFESAETSNIQPPQETLFEYPPKVMAIIENKCLGCHNPDARNEKAKAKLQWEKLPKMNKAEVIANFDEILEVLEEGSMPPSRMLEKYPEKALTKKETKELTEWFASKADELIGE